MGRPAEALRTYEHCRRRLREELGADPSAQTLALYEQILAGRSPERDGALSRSAPSVPFLGRHAELARLISPLDGCGLRVVVGEPGIGKSRLVEEALARLGDRPVRSTKCFRLTSPVPYAVLADLAPELRSSPGRWRPRRRPGKRRPSRGRMDRVVREPTARPRHRRPAMGRRTQSRRAWVGAPAATDRAARPRRSTRCGAAPRRSRSPTSRAGTRTRTVRDDHSRPPDTRRGHRRRLFVRRLETHGRAHAPVHRAAPGWRRPRSVRARDGPRLGGGRRRHRVAPRRRGSRSTSAAG